MPRVEAEKVLSARWIWDSADSRREWNHWCAFRRDFEVNLVPDDAALLISADAEYAVWVNGEWVGQGPSRGFPDNYKYDRYIVHQFLRTGANSIAILAKANGISTFRYVLGDAGVIAEIVGGGTVVISTDETWSCLPDPFGPPKDLRMSCQLGWLEPAALGPDLSWTLPGFGEEGWVKCVAVEDARRLSQSEVQCEVVDSVKPVGVVCSRVVRAPATIWTLALRRALLPGHVEAGPKEIFALVTLVFHVKQSGQVIFELPRDWFWVQAKGKLNGVPLESCPSRRNTFEAAPALRGEVRQGQNTLILDVSGHYHEWTFTISVDDAELILDFPVLVTGPLMEPERLELYARAESQEIAAHEATTALHLSAPDVMLDSAFVRTAHAQVLSEVPSDLADLVFGEEETQIILDLGRMTVGYWKFEVEAEEPARIIVNGFESIQDGQLDFCWEMANTFEKSIPAGNHILRSLQRRGARFLLFQAKSCTIRNVEVLESTLQMKRGGRFNSSSPDLNQIHKISARTAQLCSEDTFVDCPTYEQTFWAGDARNEALINYAVSGDWSFVKRCWNLAAESLQSGGLVNSQVPSGWQTIIPAWSFLWQIACWEHYQYAGDEKFLKEIYPSIRRQTDNALELINSDGLFEIEAWNLTDWSGMDQPGRGVVTAGQGWFAWALKSSAAIAKHLGQDADAESDLRAIDHIAKAVNSNLWDVDRGAYVDCIHYDGSRSEVFSAQTQCVLSLAGLPPPERQARLNSIISGEVTEGFVQPGTPFFQFFIMEFLERIGEYKRIYQIIEDKWGLMVDKGATTCWELFPGYMPGGRWTRSHCHAWSAGPPYFLSRIALGIVRNGTAHERVLFRPVPNGLESCSGSVPTVRGPINVEWWYGPSGFDYRLNLPSNCDAEVDLSRV